MVGTMSGLRRIRTDRHRQRVHTPNVVSTGCRRFRVRQIQILVPEDQREDVTDLLDDEGIDYVRQRVWANDDDKQWLVEFPVPTDAIGYVFDRLDETGVEQDQYTVVTSVETAMTPNTESLRERFASDFDPLTDPELRRKPLT